MTDVGLSDTALTSRVGWRRCWPLIGRRGAVACSSLPVPRRARDGRRPGSLPRAAEGWGVWDWAGCEPVVRSRAKCETRMEQVPRRESVFIT